MYIRRIEIRNVRGFGEVDLDFSRPDGSLAGWTVLAGRNGSGKSSLLRILAATMLGPSKIHALNPNIARWLKEGSENGSSRIEAELGKHEIVRPQDPSRRPLKLSWKSSEGKPSLKFERKFADPLDVLFWQRAFLSGYGPYRRLTGSAAEAESLMAGPDELARLVTLFREDASLLESVSWLREIYLRRLEEKPGAAELEQAVLSLLRDGLLPDKAQVEKVDSDGLWVLQSGARLPLQELSDGYRTTAALVMDIVRHLYRCYDELRIERVEDKEGTCQRVLHEGVVLIDEVELHLHVSWQKRIGFWLKRHFPNIQFIVTTHSPFVCQAADPHGLIRLPAPGEDRSVEHVSEDLYNTVVNGSLDEAILTDLFGLETPYSESTEELRDRVAQLEARVQTGKATGREMEELEVLHSRLPQTPSSAVEQALRKLAADA